MVDKVRDIVAKLSDMADTVKADDIEGRLKTGRENAVRQLYARNRHCITVCLHDFVECIRQLM